MSARAEPLGTEPRTHDRTVLPVSGVALAFVTPPRCRFPSLQVSPELSQIVHVTRAGAPEERREGRRPQGTGGRVASKAPWPAGGGVPAHWRADTRLKESVKLLVRQTFSQLMTVER